MICRAKLSCSSGSSGNRLSTCALVNRRQVVILLSEPSLGTRKGEGRGVRRLVLIKALSRASHAKHSLQSHDAPGVVPVQRP